MTVKLRRRTRGGKLTWYVDASGQRPDGSRYRVERKSPVQTRVGAQEFGRQLDEQLALGRHGAPVPTLDAFWRAYGAYLNANTKPSHARAVEVAGRRHILPALSGLRLDAIGVEQVENLKAGMLKAEYAPHTVNNVLGYLHRALSLAKKYGKVDAIPEAGLIEYDEAEAEWLEPDEQQRFLEAARHWPERYFLLGVLLGTGLRIGEALALRWADVDTRRGVLVVRRTRVAVSRGFGRPKEGPSREVHLETAMVELFRSQRHLRELVFTTPDGQPMTHSMVKRWVGAAAKRAGIAKHITNHSLRHSRTAILVMAGCTDAWIMAELGWTTRSVLRRYTHLSPKHSQDQIQRVEEFRGMAHGKKKAEHDE